MTYKNCVGDPGLNPFVFREVLSPLLLRMIAAMIVLIPSCSGKFYHLNVRRIDFVSDVLIPSCSGKFYHVSVSIVFVSVLVLIPSCSGKFYHTY